MWAACVRAPHQFTTGFPKAVIREGRAMGTFVGRCGLARLCKAICSEIERQGWETMYYYCEGLHQAVGIKKLGEGREEGGGKEKKGVLWA